MTTLTQVYRSLPYQTFPYANSVYASDPTYADIQSGAAATLIPEFADFQPRNSFNGSSFTVVIGFTRFDTRAIGAATAAVLKARCAVATSTASDNPTEVLQVYAIDAGAEITAGDWLTPAALAALTLVAELSYADMPKGTLADATFDDIALLANIAFADYTGLAFVLKSYVSEATPIGSNFCNVDSGHRFNVDESAGGIRLELTYDGTAATPTGAQPAATGGIASILQGVVRGGSQPAATGTIAAQQTLARSLAGNQPSATGHLPSIDHNFADDTLDTRTLSAVGATAYISSGSTYAIARAGAGASPLAGLYFGQNYGLDGGGEFSYSCLQTQFTLRDFPATDFISALFTTASSPNYAGDPDTIELRSGTIGAWVTDWDATDLIATAPISKADGLGAWTVDLDALPSAGPGFIIVSRRLRLGITPSKLDESFTTAPVLVIQYTDVHVQGDQPSPTGTINSLQHKALRGAQGRPAGTITASNRVTLYGSQPSSTGAAEPARRPTPFLPAGQARSANLPAGKAHIRRSN